MHMAEVLPPEQSVAVKAFMDWLAMPPGWPLRCLLAERRKDRAKNFPAEHVAATASSGGRLPWAFGPPGGGKS